MFINTHMYKELFFYQNFYIVHNLFIRVNDRENVIHVDTPLVT